MKIACIGNCQLETLTWYLRYLLPESESMLHKETGINYLNTCSLIYCKSLFFD